MNETPPIDVTTEDPEPTGADTRTPPPTDFSNAEFCKNCGHMKQFHVEGGGCIGVVVVDMENQVDGPCDCPGWLLLTDEKPKPRRGRKRKPDVQEALVITRPEESTAIEKAQPQNVSPFDIDPDRFKAGLERRVQNRNALLETLAKIMVDKTDKGRIHVKSKNECSYGNQCTNEYHWSKPVLFKAGAEKINQFLGLKAQYRPLTEQERKDYGISVVDQIVVKCELVMGGFVVSEGLGARAIDPRDGVHALNKALKMAEKSARINATIQLGLSDCFTQDLDDMMPGAEPEPAKDMTPDLERAVESAATAKPGAAPLQPKPEEKGKGDLREYVAGLDCECGSPVMRRTSQKGSPFMTCSLYYDATYGKDAKAKELLDKVEAQNPALKGKHYYKSGKKT